jgi:hypothetical protein
LEQAKNASLGTVGFSIEAELVNAHAAVRAHGYQPTVAHYELGLSLRPGCNNVAFC